MLYGKMENPFIQRAEHRKHKNKVHENFGAHIKIYLFCITRKNYLQGRCNNDNTEGFFVVVACDVILLRMSKMKLVFMLSASLFFPICFFIQLIPFL